MMTQNKLFVQFAEPWQPHDYQKKAMKFLIEHACGALFLDPGLGKSSITLGTIKVLRRKKVVGKTLLIAPLRVATSTWPDELAKWSDFSDMTYQVLHGPDKDERLREEADLYIINPEGLDWLLQTTKTMGKSLRKSVAVDRARFKALGFDTLVIDELTTFKNTNSDRYKALKQVHTMFGRRWGLTGSPAANGLLDLFGQCYILDEGRSLGRYVTQYRTKYFERPNPKNPFLWTPKKDGIDGIYEALSPLALRMSAEDHLPGMPQMVVNRIKLDMPESAREFYDRLENDLISTVNDEVFVAHNSAVASMKCRQVVNGAIYLDPEVTALGIKAPRGAHREWVELHDVKLDAMSSLVDELQGKPLLVAYEFKHDLERLLKRFPGTPYVGGGVSPVEGRVIEQQWNRGEIKMLFGHPSSIGRGLNLQGAGNHVAWFSLTWDYELYDQLIRRVLRQGNKHKHVFVHHLMIRDSVDEAVFNSCLSKKRGQQALFDALKQLALARRRRKV